MYILRRKKLFELVSDPFVYVLYNKICSIRLKMKRNKKNLIKKWLDQTNKLVAYTCVFSMKSRVFNIIIREFVNFKLCQLAAKIKLGEIPVTYNALKGRSNGKWV